MKKHNKIKKKKWNWRNRLMEFFSIFVAVVSAFALNNWNENRRDNQAATKILTEISNGLEKDLEDININIAGHRGGVNACIYWRKIISNQNVDPDSLTIYYLALTRDFFSAQNNSGYETLKSRGLELVANDSLRFDIISLYEYDYESLKTMEENYYEMQFQENYFEDFNKSLAPYFVFDDKGEIIGLKSPINLKPDEKNILLSYLWKIEKNRHFIMSFYNHMEDKINDLTQRIEDEI